MNRNSIRLLTSAILLMLAYPGNLRAHAFLEKAEPRVGSIVEKSPAMLRVWFTQELDPEYCRLQVFDSHGKQVDKKDTRVDSKDEKLMVVSLPALPAGKYKVSWRAVSSDTHRTRGSFEFTVKPKS